MIKLAVSGCLGRMGQRITALALGDKNFKLTALLENKDHPQINSQVHGLKVTSDPSALKGSQVLIEFTSPDATIEHVNACVKNKVKMVIGTTGLTAQQIAAIKKAARKTAIVLSSNMSVGVNVLFDLARETARKTAGAYTVKIVEAHHIHKKDAPSGTAKTIAEVIEDASKRKVADIASIREGEIIGDHTVTFESSVDTITISHHAKTRDIFAAGSLVAAKFLAKKQKGLFNMEEVLKTK